MEERRRKWKKTRRETLKGAVEQKLVPTTRKGRHQVETSGRRASRTVVEMEARGWSLIAKRFTVIRQRNVTQLYASDALPPHTIPSG